METRTTDTRGTSAEPPPASGLEGIVVAHTKLSHVDGEHGRLIIAGHDVERLAGEVTFEDACALIWSLSGDPVEDLRASLFAARAQAFSRLSTLGDALRRPVAMDALRTALSHLPDSSSAVELVGAAAVFTAAWHRLQIDAAPVAPRETHAHAEDFLSMLGLPAAPLHAAAIDAYFVTVVDHGLNASTFAARVIASTESDRVSAVVGAVGALKGPLHGGAPGPVLDMLDTIGASTSADAFLRARLLAGERIMGMGHRIYRVRDPRALVLERAIERLSVELSRTEGTKEQTSARLALARAVEHSAERLLAERYPNRALRANVEFYTAVLLEALGIPRTLFTAAFASSRIVGWTAHYSEQRKTGRLIRPASHYIGRRPA